MPSPEHTDLVATLRAAPVSPDLPSVADLRAAMEAMGTGAPVPAGVTVSPVTLGGVPAERHHVTSPGTTAPAAHPAGTIVHEHGGGPLDVAPAADASASPDSPPHPAGTIVHEHGGGPLDVAPAVDASTPPVSPPHPAGTIGYLHGGGHVAGSPASHRSLAARLALATGRDVVVVDHRLAPEHPHPAGVEDATAVVDALLADGHDPARLVLAGDSAGGGLVVSTLLALAAAGSPRPAAAVLLSPWLDLTLAGPSTTTVDDPLLRRDVLVAGAALHAAGADLDSPSLSPVFATDEQLGTLPPLLVVTGTGDMLIDDSRAFAARARAAGATVDLVVEDDLIHVWPLFPHLPETTATLAGIARWLDRRLTPVGYGFHATMTAVPGRGDELVDLLLSGPVTGPAAADACVVFLVGRSASDPDLVFLTEGWTSEEAHAEVFASAEAQAYMARFAPLVSGDATYVDEVPLGGKPTLR